MILFISQIRKAAQHAICSILKGSLIFQDNSDIVFHPMAKRTGAYCLESLDNCISIGEVTQTLHILLLLQQVLVTFHENHVKVNDRLNIFFFSSVKIY